MQQLFIINPTAGKTDASVVLVPQIQAAAARAGVDAQIECHPQPRPRAANWPKPPQPAGKKSVSTPAGGDGTMNEVLQGAANHAQYRGGLHSLRQRQRLCAQFRRPGRISWIWMPSWQPKPSLSDLLATPQGYGIDICAAGIDAQVANGIPKWRRIPLCGGTTAYTLSILEAVCSSFRHHLHIQADDR